MAINGIQCSRTSSLLESFGCLEKTNITIFVPDMSEYVQIGEIIYTIEDPCHTVLIFSTYTQEIVQWKNNLNGIMNTDKSVGKQNIEFISRSLREQNVMKMQKNEFF